jgi:hypothetical protein
MKKSPAYRGGWLGKAGPNEPGNSLRDAPAEPAHESGLVFFACRLATEPVGFSTTSALMLVMRIIMHTYNHIFRITASLKCRFLQRNVI